MSETKRKKSHLIAVSSWKIGGGNNRTESIRRKLYAEPCQVSPKCHIVHVKRLYV